MGFAQQPSSILDQQSFTFLATISQKIWSTLHSVMNPSISRAMRVEQLKGTRERTLSSARRRPSKPSHAPKKIAEQSGVWENICMAIGFFFQPDRRQVRAVSP